MRLGLSILLVLLLGMSAWGQQGRAPGARVLAAVEVLDKTVSLYGADGKYILSFSDEYDVNNNDFYLTGAQVAEVRSTYQKTKRIARGLPHGRNGERITHRVPGGKLIFMPCNEDDRGVFIFVLSDGSADRNAVFFPITPGAYEYAKSVAFENLLSRAR